MRIEFKLPPSYSQSDGQNHYGKTNANRQRGSRKWNQGSIQTSCFLSISLSLSLFRSLGLTNKWLSCMCTAFTSDLFSLLNEEAWSSLVLANLLDKRFVWAWKQRTMWQAPEKIRPVSGKAVFTTEHQKSIHFRRDKEGNRTDDPRRWSRYSRMSCSDKRQSNNVARQANPNRNAREASRMQSNKTVEWQSMKFFSSDWTRRQKRVKITPISASVTSRMKTYMNSTPPSKNMRPTNWFAILS